VAQSANAPDPESGKEPIGVRGEHELRVQVKDMTAQNQRLVRAVEATHRYVYGRQDASDLAGLKRILASVGYPSPSKTSAADPDA
jgi:hypothetical protein